MLDSSVLYVTVLENYPFHKMRFSLLDEMVLNMPTVKLLVI